MLVEVKALMTLGEYPAGLARVASLAMATGGDKSVKLSPEARCILFAARDRGVIEVKGANRAFDAPGRMLAVYVETEADRTLIFSEPIQTP